MAKVTVNTHSKYYSQNLNNVWSPKVYPKYKSGEWFWYNLPFMDNYTSKNIKTSRFYSISKSVEKKSILEVGSAMGQGYNFLKQSPLIDVSDYTGIDVSNTGHNYSKETFPETNWIQADFTQYELDRKYDYAFERHAIHHMPDPIAQYKKLLRHVNLGMSTTFRGCIEGKTISDLDKGFFRHEDSNDYFYLNVINIFEFVKIALDEGFNHIRVEYSGPHEPIPTDPKGNCYLAPELQSNHLMTKFRVRINRCLELDRPLVYAVPSGPRLLITQPRSFIKLILGLKIIKLFPF